MSELATRQSTAIAIAEEIAEKHHNARYAGAVVDALRRAHQANPAINQALLMQVTELIKAAELYEAGVEAGEFAPAHRPKVSETRTLTQVDGEVEINGRLFRYDKKGPHGDISRGAHNTATNLARERGDLTLFAWGDRFDIESIQVCNPGGMWTARGKGGKEDVQRIAKEWAVEADNRKAA